MAYTKRRSVIYPACALFGLALAIIGGCGGGEKGDRAKPSSQAAPTPQAETGFNPALAAQAETHWTPPLPAPTAIPAPILKVKHDQKLILDPQSAGTASVSVLDTPLKTGTGSMSAAKRGDYLLANGKVALYFAAVKPRRNEKEIEIPLAFTNTRHQGALLDVIAGGAKADFLSEFTQGLGVDSNGPIMDYDSAEFVTRASPPAVGIRLTGSTGQSVTDEVRIQTEYWLADGEQGVQVETRVLQGDPDAPIADLVNFGQAGTLCDIHGPFPSGGATREAQWYAAQLGSVAIGVAVYKGKMSGFFSQSQARTVAYQEGDAATRKRLETRWIFAGEGQFSAVTDQIFAQGRLDRPTAVLKGRVLTRETEKPVPGAVVNVFWYDRELEDKTQGLVTHPFTKLLADEKGNYQGLVPILDLKENKSRFFLGTSSRSRQSGLMNRSVVLSPDFVAERDLQIGEPARLTVKVIDSKTSAPLAARVRFEAIAPAPLSLFDDMRSPSGYMNSFYVPRSGATIEMSQGTYTLTVSHGITHNLAKVDAELQWGLETEAVIALDEISPTPGWTGLEIGAMTNATPGSSLSAEDMVTMCAGEGVQWIVSGDLNTITDFAPAIARLGLNDIIGSSRGFRTYLPKRPEWGDFLVYPLPADAPDPKAASEKWNGLDKSREFIAMLRSLYPGALIHAGYPYAEPIPLGALKTTDGYFHVPNWNVYEMAFSDQKRTEDIDMSVDLANAFSPAGGWFFGWDKDFFFIHTLRKRFIIPAPVSSARQAFFSEPGYPRLLIRTDEDKASRVDEAALFKALKAGKWMDTSGPFIDYRADGRREGDLYQPAKKVFTKIRITAPDWAATTHISMCLDGTMLWNQTDTADEKATERIKWSGEVELSPEFRENADTLMNVSTNSEKTIDEILPRPAGARIPSFCMIGPVIADSNGNGEFDPPAYINRGK